MLNNPILIIDGQNNFIRYFCANPFLTTDGKPAGGIAGFLNLIQRLASQTRPSQIFCVWEGKGGSTRKRKIYPDYKNKRVPPKLNRFYPNDEIPIDNEENRKIQNLNLVKLLQHIPINQIYVDQTEADDIIGYLCRYKFKDEHKIIVSTDRDFYQLLNDTTKIYSPAKKIFITQDDVVEQHNIHPENFCLCRAIVGDRSDNVPGVKSCGEKTVAKNFTFLKENSKKTIHDIFEFCEQNIEEKNIYKKILENKEIIVRNWKLMYLDTQQFNQAQINKLNFKVDNFTPRLEKLSFLKILHENHLQKFDFERLFASLSYLANKL